MVANVMFDLPAVEWSTTARSGGELWFAEGIATLGLLLVIFGVVRSGRSTVAAFAVAGYIAGAYYFTSSTSFANPAVTIGRAFSNTFAGIEPASVPMFVVAQLIGAAVAVPLVLVIYPDVAEVAGDVIVPHGDERHRRAPGPRLTPTGSSAGEGRLRRCRCPRRERPAPRRSLRAGGGTTPTCPAARDRSGRL